MKLFKNHAVQVRMVKSDTANAEARTIDPVLVNDIALVQVQNVALCVGAVLFGKKLVDTACQIAVVVTSEKARAASDIAVQAANAALWKQS